MTVDCAANHKWMAASRRIAHHRIAGAGRKAANAHNLAAILRSKRAARVMISPGNYRAAQLLGRCACFCPSLYL